MIYVHNATLVDNLEKPFPWIIFFSTDEIGVQLNAVPLYMMLYQLSILTPWKCFLLHQHLQSTRTNSTYSLRPGRKVLWFLKLHPMYKIQWKYMLSKLLSRCTTPPQKPLFAEIFPCIISVPSTSPGCGWCLRYSC